MSFDYRFEPPTLNDFEDVDLTICEDCPHKECGCRDGGDCVMEEE